MTTPDQSPVLTRRTVVDRDAADGVSSRSSTTHTSPPFSRGSHRSESMSSELPMVIEPEKRDLLSEVMLHTEARAVMPAPWVLKAPWAIELPVGPCPCVYVQSGRCRVRMPELAEEVMLDTGDLFIFSHPSPAVLCDSPQTPPIPLFDLLLPDHIFDAKPLVHGGDGALTRLLSGAIVLQERPHAPLSAALPAYLHLTANDIHANSAIRSLLTLLGIEAASVAAPGRLRIIDNLLQAIFVHAVRCQLSTGGRAADMTLLALANPEIGPVLTMVHIHPGRQWSVESMAELAGMSRSAFSAQFTEVVEQTPMAYVVDCRMRQASRWLRHGSMGVKEIAAQLGYNSDAAFSVAFKRWAGLSPGKFRQQSRHE